MSAESIRQLISAAVGERIDALSRKTFEELSGLPNQSSEELTLEGTKVILSVWHDTVTPQQDHRIVVQAYKPGLLGTGRMHAEGFVVNSRDEKRTLTQEEWAPFS